MTIAGTTLDRCTRCGLCLSSCPTYLETRMEHDGPRGRVWTLLAAVRDGDAPPTVDPTFWDCTGCGLCVAPCPTGVDLPAELDSLWSALNRGGPAADPGPPRPPASAAERGLEAVRAQAVARLRRLDPELPEASGPTAGAGPLIAFSPYLTALRPDAPARARRLLTALDGGGGPTEGHEVWERWAAAACGLLADDGRPADDRRAVEALRRATPGGSTVVLLDLAASRLAAVLAPAGVEVLPLPRYLAQRHPGRWRFEPATGTELLDTAVPEDDWYAPLLDTLPEDHPRPVLLPRRYAGVAGRDLQHPRTVASLRRQAEGKGRWLDGRGLLTADPRSLARHSTARFYLEGLHHD
ncbi:4Fe-4S dicluster domain-containing protein [Kitasatospora sp. NPDC094015]|uniref:4Fe-4S dicluster domain-containing protein n=1 Tax=Kitasatospora sp. NPDC094015 TaxID=3155205 RepID=UPI00333448F6